MAVFRMSNKRYGMKKELQVAEFLKNRGFRCRRSRGSRGPADLVARNEQKGLYWLIQVKSTRAHGDFASAFQRAIKAAPALRRAAEARRIRCRSRDGGIVCRIRRFRPEWRTPVVAVVQGNYVWFFDVSGRDARLIMEGKLEELRGKYDEYP